MLLTISTTHQPATDLGYLLHKNPARPQTEDLSFGKAYVFYPDASDDLCTAALLVEIDPMALVRGRGPAGEGGQLEQYVNDRPYAANSFLSVAMGRIFSTAMSGRSKDRPELAETAIPLTTHLPVIAARGGEELVRRLFEPLGYTLKMTGSQLDERFPEWGASPYVALTLVGTVRLQDLLTHLYVLIPVLDNEKHYWVATDEIEKLLKRGEGWLGNHPEKDLIVSRYLKRQRSLTREALSRLLAEDAPDDEADETPAVESPSTERAPSLHDQRLQTVLSVLRDTGAKRVVDLGCGEGKLLKLLLAEKQFEMILGMDVSWRTLETAKERLRFDELPERQRSRIELIQGSLTYRDQRLNGFEAAAIVEVIEHLDAPRLATFERIVFEFARPTHVVLTTPNAEYNAVFETLPAGEFRHGDHRFEWKRAEFEGWTGGVAERFGYGVRFEPGGADRPRTWRTNADGSIHPEGGGGMKISVPELSLVLLVGPSGSGKSSFARKHFLPTEVVSSDFCRAVVADNENDQSATGDAFDLLHEIVRKRLARGRLTVVDATNVQPEARKSLIALAKEFHLFAEAIVFDLSERICQDRNVLRPDRQFGPHVIRNQSQQLRRSLRGLDREGIRHVFKLSSPEDVDAVTIERQPLWNNRKTEHGPFDIVGDVHGCFDELVELMAQLGYVVNQQDGAYSASSPADRKLVFVGDLVDRGPGTVQVLRLVSGMVQSGQAFCVPGNHDMKLVRALRGKDVKHTHGLAETMEQLGHEANEFRVEVAKFLDGLVSHLVFDDGKLVVAHAGLKESMHGRGSGAVREFALFGETTGETDEFGLPVRYNWAADYRGKALVVYGHTPVPEPLFLNNTVNLDTGCVFGGQLTALRYPEREIVSVKAHRTYYEPARPFLPESTETQRPLQHAQDDVLDLADVVGKRLIDTRLKAKITIREENAIAALEVMSRFASDPKWLIYLPPTMSPTETSKRENLLEHPDEAFSFYRKEGIGTVVCEQKHMGSRAVVVLCKDEAVSQRRFGVVQASLGTVYIRTGRRFFTDETLEHQFLARLQSAVEKAGLWDELATDWLCLDCELMPWSAKAQELLQKQYAPVGNAGVRALRAESDLLTKAMLRVPGLEALAAQTSERVDAVEHYTQAYRQYCWPVQSLADLKLAPFHILASESTVHTDKPHTWHMEMIGRLCAADTEILFPTPFKIVDLQNEASTADAVAWWTEMTAQGREGMVVKPLNFIAEGRRGLTQPAIKCRGAEYLRIIYGPEYLLPANLERLRARNVGAKRSLASREFALGIEALERFVRKDPLRLTHECVFGVLALESEPIDPRL